MGVAFLQTTKTRYPQGHTSNESSPSLAKQRPTARASGPRVNIPTKQEMKNKRPLQGCGPCLKQHKFGMQLAVFSNSPAASCLTMPSNSRRRASTRKEVASETMAKNSRSVRLQRKHEGVSGQTFPTGSVWRVISQPALVFRRVMTPSGDLNRNRVFWKCKCRVWVPPWLPLPASVCVCLSTWEACR